MIKATTWLIDLWIALPYIFIVKIYSNIKADYILANIKKNTLNKNTWPTEISLHL